MTAHSVPIAATCPACGAPTERQRSVYGVIGASGAVVLLCSEACAREASGSDHHRDRARQLAQPCLRCGVRIDRHACSAARGIRCADGGEARSLIDPWFTRTHVERSPGVWELVAPLT